MRAMDKLLSWENWPVLIICLAMIASAVIDWWKFKVPNLLTFPVILSGWLLGGLYDVHLLQPGGEADGWWRILSSLVCTFEGCFLLYWLYLIGGVGAGDVKMQMGFGAWVGAFYGFKIGVPIVFFAFVVGALVGGIIATGMILVRRQFSRNAQNLREIISDWFKAGSVQAIAEKAAQRKARLHLLPYGVPLCIGFVGYLVYRYASGTL
jgi:prepilin peptidase CpaA